MKSQFVSQPFHSDPNDLIRSGLDSCEQLLSRHLSNVARVYGANGLDLIDLPPLGPEPLVSAQLRVAAVLYWCYQLELAGLLPFVEALAQQVATGALPLPVGNSAQALMPFWRSTEHRFSAVERTALFNRMFNVVQANQTADARGFEARCAALTDSLSKIGRERQDRSITYLQVRAGQLAQMIGRQLSDRAVGISAYAARDIVRQIRQALEVLNNPEIAHALGGGSPWRILHHWGRQLLQRNLNITTHVNRAESGSQILRWISDAAPNIESAARSILRHHPLVQAAEAWRASISYSGTIQNYYSHYPYRMKSPPTHYLQGWYP